MVEIENKNMPIHRIATQFEPNEDTNMSASYTVPEHQRFFTWKPSQEYELIDTILKGFPMPSIILHEAYDKERSKICYNVEDGQQRLTSVHRFINGKYTYNDKYYPCESVIEKGLPQISLEDVRKLDNYQIPVTVIKGILDIDTKALIFHRLNNGKKLSDADKFWSMKNTPIVSYTCDILKRESSRIIGNFTITNKTRTGLTDGVGLVLGLSEGDDKITTSYEKLYSFLKNEPNCEKVEKGMKFISEIYSRVKDSGLELKSSQKRNLGKILGILVKEYNSITDENERSVKIEFWTDFLKIVARNSTEFWNQIVTRSRRGANINGLILTERITNIHDFMELNENERKTMCDVLKIEYVCG